MATTAKDVMTARVFAWIVRAILLVAALFLLRWAETAYANYELVSRINFHLDGADFVGVVALFILAGLGFGLAIRFPFTQPRFAWGWLLFAAVAVIPAAHFWYVFSGSADGLLSRYFWFDSSEMVHIGAVLAGVSIASGIGGRAARG